MIYIQYEKAASVLSSHDPPIILAKVNGDDAANRQLGQKFDIKGFPTLFIVKDGGKKVQEYNGPPDADGIVNYLKRQLGPASTEIKSSEDAATFIDEKGVAIVSIICSSSAVCFHHEAMLKALCILVGWSVSRFLRRRIWQLH